MVELLHSNSSTDKKNSSMDIGKEQHGKMEPWLHYCTYHLMICSHHQLVPHYYLNHLGLWSSVLT